MDFVKRLGYFLVKDIRSKPLLYSDEINQLIHNKTLDSAAIIAFLYEGDVDFGSSDTKSKPCRTYLIEGLVNEKEAVLTVRNCVSKAMVQSIKIGN